MLIKEKSPYLILSAGLLIGWVCGFLSNYLLDDQTSLLENILGVLILGLLVFALVFSYNDSIRIKEFRNLVQNRMNKIALNNTQNNIELKRIKKKSKINNHGFNDDTNQITKNYRKRKK